MKQTATLTLALTLALVLGACATQTSEPYKPLAEAQAKLPQSSPECLAKKIKAGDPLPASAIPEATLQKRQSGWVAMRYDLTAGKPQNIEIVASHPAGLYDAPALEHAARYRDPAGTTVRGCVMSIEVKF
ncbi:MAG: hypothetical protein Q8M96_04680 [Rubrivivax sp.]|nr:hypothetical protein [Rubrivivax sp.]